MKSPKLNSFLILGSSGLIGKNLCRLLKNNCLNFTEFDILNNDEEDLRIFKNKKLEHLIQQCDFIFFLAFDVGGYKYLSTQQYKFEFIHNNITLQANTFELIKKYNKPFIFTSTQMSAIRYLPYGTIKIVGEHYTQALNGLYVRLWNVYGKEPDNEKSHVITDFIRMAREEKKITMITDGSEERQFLHVSDCVQCLYKLAINYHEINRSIPLHITSFEWIKVRYLADIISSLHNDIPIYEGKYISDVQIHNKNEPERDILQYWSPNIKLADGLKQLIIN